MTHPNIVCVVPTCRPDRHAQFVADWRALFDRHAVTLVTAEDGDNPGLVVEGFGDAKCRFGPMVVHAAIWATNEYRDVVCRRTDAVRNLGFIEAAKMRPDFVLTLDDDVRPVTLLDKAHMSLREAARFGDVSDPIQSHLDVLARRAPVTWMSTADDGECPRGMPYGVRDEAPVMLSHGVWAGVPDFDAETQLRFEQAPGGVPRAMPYRVGPVPKGVLFPLCGMNVMVRRDALPHLYFAPMGPDAGSFPCPTCPGRNEILCLVDPGPCPTCGGPHGGVGAVHPHRFADIFMGIFLKREFDRRGWACHTGGAVVWHARASDAAKNFQQERLGRNWLEFMSWLMTADAIPENVKPPPGLGEYLQTYGHKRRRFAALVARQLGGPSDVPVG